MWSIAECDTSSAEELLVLYARGAFAAEPSPRDREHRFRRDYIFQALGRLHPRTNGTYSLLDKEWTERSGPPGGADPHDFFATFGGNTNAFQALVSIGDERSAGILRREMFNDARDWAAIPNLETWLSEIAKHRDKPANFELLFSLVKDAPSAQTRERILPYLVQRQIRRGTGLIHVYPGYDNLPVATREKLLKVVNAADRTKFSQKGAELLNRLKEELSNPKPVWFSAQEKAEVDYAETIRQNSKDAKAHYNRGAAHYRMRDTQQYDGDYKESLTNGAVADFKEAIRLDPNYAAAYDALAWLRATDANAWNRDGKAAVANAKKAYEVSGGKNWHYLHTLAAAYAESGDFASAVESEAKALALAKGDATPPDMESIRSNLERFRRGEPYHQTPVRYR